MEIVKKISEVREKVRQARFGGKTIGLVPTMGALHEGHLSLMRAAKEKCDYVVVSIFVNPTQFGPNEDFGSYPRTLQADSEKCESVGVDLIFAPEVIEMYPKKNTTWVDVEGELTNTLCGAARPGHFRGVTTVCSKLFNIALPDIAFFGQKDAQQAAVIKRMVKDLNMPLQIEVCPIVREDSGLAMSSRNKYLSDDQRNAAAGIYKALKECQAEFESGQKDAEKLIQNIENKFSANEYFDVDYIKIVDFDSFQEMQTIVNKALVAVAVRVGPARLIDNIILDLNS